MPLNTNIPAFSLTISTLLRNPSLLLPNLTIPTLLHLPEQLGPHLLPSPSSSPSSSFGAPQSQSQSQSHVHQHKHKYPQIRALVLDKDNAIAPPHSPLIPPSYMQKLHDLRTNPTSPFNQTTNPHGILIVSNTAGSNPSSQLRENEAIQLEETLSHLKIPVFRAPMKNRLPGAAVGGVPMKKPFSYPAILKYLQERNVVEGADEIAVVGDRLGTDVLMASLMGAWSVWLRDGVTEGSEGVDKGKQGMDYRGVLAKGEAHMERYLIRRGVKPSLPAGWEDSGS